MLSRLNGPSRQPIYETFWGSSRVMNASKGQSLDRAHEILFGNSLLLNLKNPSSRSEFLACEV